MGGDFTPAPWSLIVLWLLLCLLLGKETREKTKQQNKKENKPGLKVSSPGLSVLCPTHFIPLLPRSPGVILSVSYAPCFHTAPIFFTSVKILLTKNYYMCFGFQQEIS